MLGAMAILRLLIYLTFVCSCQVGFAVLLMVDFFYDFRGKQQDSARDIHFSF